VRVPLVQEFYDWAAAQSDRVKAEAKTRAAAAAAAAQPAGPGLLSLLRKPEPRAR
jgi:hypothetical protein